MGQVGWLSGKADVELWYCFVSHMTIFSSKLVCIRNVTGCILVNVNPMFYLMSFYKTYFGELPYSCRYRPVNCIIKNP